MGEVDTLARAKFRGIDSVRPANPFAKHNAARSHALVRSLDDRVCVDGVVASTVPVGTSATSKRRVGHFHTPDESASCTTNQIPIPPCDPPPDRSARASRPDLPPQNTSSMPDQFGPTPRPRGGPRSRRATVMVTTTATWLRPGHVW